MEYPEILEHMRRHPFVPVRVFFSDGATYTVTDPVYILLSERTFMIGYDIDEEGIAQKAAEYKPADVARIELLDDADAA
jgi:hypothetical protein